MVDLAAILSDVLMRGGVDIAGKPTMLHEIWHSACHDFSSHSG